MPGIEELSSSKSSQWSALKTGIDTLAGGTSPVTFTKYNRKVLPLDGFVFWILSGLETDPVAPPTTRTVAGSFHLSTDKLQEDEQTYGINKCIFTSEYPIIQGFEYEDPQIIYIGNFPNPQHPSTSIAFAFSSQSVYKEADIWHYKGDAVYPFMSSQIINSAADIPTDGAIISNSLPLWLALNNYAPFYGFGNSIELFPAQLVAANSKPPFGAINVLPEGTEAIGSVPWLGKRSTHSQLARDKVTVTFYGLDNAKVMDFLDCVMQRSTDYGAIGQSFGLLNSPIIRDERVKQVELSILAQKKVVDFEVAYFQRAARDIARQLILSAVPSVTTSWPTKWLPDPVRVTAIPRAPRTPDPFVTTAFPLAATSGDPFTTTAFPLAVEINDPFAVTVAAEPIRHHPVGG